MKALLGTKLGMTQVFSPDGTVTPVTVIQAGPCVVTQKKTVDSDGYEAIQIAFGDVKAKRLNKPLLGHLKKAGATPKRHLLEVPGLSEVAVGEVLDVSLFEAGETIKVSGITKGKGFQGVMKRHGFAGGPGGHGAHFHRAPGSIGASADPARVYAGSRLPGQMGSKRATQRGLTVVSADNERNLLLVKGSVPGSKGSLVVVRGQ